ncbi:hypothetical protein EV356DRAFT_572970 [Viridothelium virens]|uniref:Snf7-domain-containing protein n=1 Tax=Viridothelium virens TaxID=1048519 RepID=A0A6A6HM57_VIRVR|nr:hypothetical protein EV356DRAFT_572970 [Viridothelium virens]
MTELLQFILDHEKAFQSTGRLASLYSDFRLQANTNPDGYNANISAWRKALADAARAGLIPSQGGSRDLLTIRTGDELVQALDSKQWGRPLALGSVIHDAVEKKEMIPLKDFLSSNTSIYSRNWTITPQQVITWMLRQLGMVGGVSTQDRLAVGQFVLVANVESAADAILKKQSSLATSSTSNIYSLSTFTSAFSDALNPSTPLSPTDISLLLTYLSRDRPSLSYSPSSGTIKFAPTSSPTPPAPITEEDTTMARLTTLIASLRTQLPLLTTRIATLDTEARSAVSSSSSSLSTSAKSVARTALRQKKLAETTLVQRGDTLAQLEAALAQIETAAGNVAVVAAMRESAEVLRGLNERVGGVEGVERVTEGLREEMGRVEEVSAVLGEVGAESVEEGEVEEESEELEREVREKEKRVREEREEREAEETRRRLAVLEQGEGERVVASREEGENGGMTSEALERKSGGKEEMPVRQATERVEGMSVDEEQAATNESQSNPAIPAE